MLDGLVGTVKITLLPDGIAAVQRTGVQCLKEKSTRRCGGYLDGADREEKENAPAAPSTGPGYSKLPPQPELPPRASGSGTRKHGSVRKIGFTELHVVDNQPKQV